MSFQIQGIEPLCLKPTPNMYDMNEMICTIRIHDVIFYNASHCKILQAESRRWDIAKLAANMLIALLDSRIFCNTIWRWQYVSVQTEGNDWKIPRQSRVVSPKHVQTWLSKRIRNTAKSRFPNQLATPASKCLRWHLHQNVGHGIYEVLGSAESRPQASVLNWS